MKAVSATMLIACVICGVGSGTAYALPRADVSMSSTAAPAPAEHARILCNKRRCYRTGNARHFYYRPYGYYRPYYDAPRPGTNPGLFGIGVY